MARALGLYDTTIGKKVVMGISGLILMGFVLTHMIGNLNLYVGVSAMNEYGVGLRNIVPGGLWIARGVLLLAVFMHILAAFQLWSRNTDARKVRYKKQKSQVTTYAARTMYWSGPILLMFIIFHLAHLTFGFGGLTVPMAGGGEMEFAFRASNIYNNVVYGFWNPLVSGFYVVANLMLGAHLFHGVWSLCQTLGLEHKRYNPIRKVIAGAFAGVVTLGNVSFPIVVMLSLSGAFPDGYGVHPTDEAPCYEELNPLDFNDTTDDDQCGPSLVLRGE